MDNKDCIKAWLTTCVLTVAGFFGLCFSVGFILGLSGLLQSPEQLENSTWFGLTVFIGLILINFFSFRFSVNKFDN